MLVTGFLRVGSWFPSCGSFVRVLGFFVGSFVGVLVFLRGVRGSFPGSFGVSFGSFLGSFVGSVVDRSWVPLWVLRWVLRSLPDTKLCFRQLFLLLFSFKTFFPPGERQNVFNPRVLWFVRLYLSLSCEKYNFRGWGASLM